MIGIFEPKRLLMKAVRVHVKSKRLLVDAMRVLV